MLFNAFGLGVYRNPISLSLKDDSAEAIAESKRQEENGGVSKIGGERHAMLEKAAQVANVISAFTGTYCAYASWTLLHEAQKPNGSSGGGAVAQPTLVVIFLVSLVVVFLSITFRIMDVIRNKTGKKLRESSKDLLAIKSELQQASREIGELKAGGAAATASVGGINIPINIPISTQTQPVASVPPSGPPKEKPEDIRPRITCIGAKKTNLTFGLESGIYEAGDDGDVDAVKVCFRNEEAFDNPGRDALGVKAHLQFMDRDGNEIGEGVSGVQWIGGKVGDEINIPRNESACVCVVFATKQPRNDRRVWGVPHMKRVGTGPFGRFGYVDDGFVLPQVPHSAVLRLSDKKGTLLPPVEIDIISEGDVLKDAKIRNDKQKRT